MRYTPLSCSRLNLHNYRQKNFNDPTLPLPYFILHLSYFILLLYNINVWSRRQLTRISHLTVRYLTYRLHRSGQNKSHGWHYFSTMQTIFDKYHRYVARCLYEQISCSLFNALFFVECNWYALYKRRRTPCNIRKSDFLNLLPCI